MRQPHNNFSLRIPGFFKMSSLSFFGRGENFTDHICIVHRNNMTYIRDIEWKVRKRFKLTNFQKVQIWSCRNTYFKRWKFKQLPGNQNRFVKAESHASELSSWHSFWERCVKLYTKILMHVVGSGWCKSRDIGRSGVLFYVCQMLSHLLHLNDSQD